MMGGAYSYVTTGILRYLVDQGVEVEVFCGMYGNTSEQIEYPESAFKKHYGKAAYYTAVSKFACNSPIFTHRLKCYDEDGLRPLINQENDRIVKVDDNEYLLSLDKEKTDLTGSYIANYCYVL